MSRRRTKVFFDGGCRPNPGPIEAAAVVRGAVHRFEGLGAGSNHDAEWRALLAALELAVGLDLGAIELIGDAAEVIAQGCAALAGAAAPAPYAEALRALAVRAPDLRIRWIKRQQNLAGIALAARHPR